MKSLKKAILLGAVLLATSFAIGAAPARYLHVRVTNPATHELVRINLPLTLAEQVIPAIQQGKLRAGKVEVGHLTADNVNIKAILNALKTAPEGEFVTVEEPGNNVRVAKERGQLVVHVIDKNSKQNVNVTIPWEVAQALITDTSEDQLNVEAAIKALENVADTTLVSVTGDAENVRIWIDSHSTGE
jgi:ribonuclease HI